VVGSSNLSGRAIISMSYGALKNCTVLYDSGMRTLSKSLLGVCLFTFTAVSWATCPEGTKNNYKGECVATTSGSETVTTTNAAFAGEGKEPISPESISEWGHTCKKEDFKTYVGTVEGCIALIKLGQVNKNKKKLMIFLHGDRKSRSDYKIKEQWNFSSVTNSEKENINFFYLARPGHKFASRTRSPGKYKNYEVLNKRKERVRFKKGWESNRLIAQALYRLKEFYKPDQLIVIGFSGGSNDIGVLNGKVPGLIDIAIMGGCDCFPRGGMRGQYWYPGEFIKQIHSKTKIILITGENDIRHADYPLMAKRYEKSAKELGLNVKAHIVKGGHENAVLLVYGREIIEEALK